MITNQAEYEIFSLGQTIIYIYLVTLPLLHLFSSCYFPKSKLISAKNTSRKWYHINLPRMKVGFSGLRCLSNSQIIPHKLVKPLCQTRTNEDRRRTISNKQSNKTLNHSSTSQELSKLSLLWKNVAVIFFIISRLYLMIWLHNEIKNFAATVNSSQISQNRW